MAEDFFKRKEAKEIQLPVHEDYDVSNFDNDMNACGITDIEGFQARHTELFSNLLVNSDIENPVATVARRIEKAFTRREIAFLMSKDLLQAAYNQSKEQLNEKQDKKGV